MTDRLKGYLVVLDMNIREDDAEPITKAIEQIRGVLSVQPLVGSVDDAIAEERAKHKFFDKLVEVLRG